MKIRHVVRGWPLYLALQAVGKKLKIIIKPLKKCHVGPNKGISAEFLIFHFFRDLVWKRQSAISTPRIPNITQLKHRPNLKQVLVGGNLWILTLTSEVPPQITWTSLASLTFPQIYAFVQKQCLTIFNISPSLCIFKTMFNIFNISPVSACCAQNVLKTGQMLKMFKMLGSQRFPPESLASLTCPQFKHFRK